MNRGDWLVAVASVVVGALLVTLVEWLRSQIDRQQRMQDRRDDFQRQTLLDLQDALYRFMLGTNLIRENFQRVRTSERELEWKVLGDPGELTQETGPRIVMLIERVDDEQLRELVADFLTGYSVIRFGSRSNQEAFDTLDTLHGIQLRANRRIGELLRKL